MTNGEASGGEWTGLTGRGIGIGIGLIFLAGDL